MSELKSRSKLIPVEKIISTDVTVKLTADWDRYTTGSMLMSSSQATFIDINGDSKIEGTFSVSHGGTAAEVAIGTRRWQISLAPLIKAALEADKNYQAEHEDL